MKDENITVYDHRLFIRLLSIAVFGLSISISCYSFSKPKSLSNRESGEYAIFIDGKREKFVVREFKGLVLSDSCFTKSKINNCTAYKARSFAKIKSINRSFGVTHPAALHCYEVGGVDLVASDANGVFRDFCQFKDKSLVSSWSLLQQVQK